MKAIISLTLRHIPRSYLQRFSHMVLKVMQVLYVGNNVKCPICNSSYRKFIPYGRKSVRDNALCPNCLSLERHRLLWLFIQQKTGLFEENLRFLHIAPELCFISRFRKLKNLKYITADLESPLADIKLDVHQIPYEDNSFDAVMCNHVMEHVDDDLQAMKEIYRILKSGGWAIMQVPFMGKNLKQTYEDRDINSPKAREKVYGQKDHVRIYGQDYPDRIRRAGFKVMEDTFFKELDPEVVKRFSLPRDEIIYFCTK